MAKQFRLEKDSEWISPENLKQQEKTERNKPVSESNTDSDFWSYKLLLNNTGNSNVESHNLIGMSARGHTAVLKKVLNQFGIINPGIIGDMGCGAGFITTEIKSRFPTSDVYGYDISVDAIQYAQKEFPKVTFNVMVIEPGISFPVKFDVIHANEFYPFTRTNSSDFWVSVLEMFLDNLNDGGLIVIGLAHTSKCILNHLDSLQQRLGKKTVKILKPVWKIYRLIPQMFVAGILTLVATKIFNTKMSYFVVIKK